MSPDGSILRTYDSLVDALSDDMLDAGDDEVLASHPAAAGRVVADHFRRRIRTAAPPEPADAPSPDPRPREPGAIAAQRGEKP